MTSAFHRGFHSLCSKLLRLRYSWTLYLVIAAGLVVLVRMHYGHQQLIELIKGAVNFDDESSTFKSTCSAAADRRGPHQNVIGYSIYGKNFSEPKFYRKYLKPFTDTLKTIPVRYPGIF